MSNILITGATGFIGKNLCSNLIEAGHKVKILVRKRQEYASFPVPLKDIVFVDWPYGLNGMNLPFKAEVIIHCANSPEIKNYWKAYDENVLSTIFLCSYAQSIGAHFVYISSQSAHKNIRSFYGMNKLASEEHIRNNYQGDWTIIRPGMVYGPGSKGLFARITSLVKKLPVIPLLDGGKQIVQPIHVDELCMAIRAISKNVSRHKKKTYSLGDPKGIEFREFIRKFARAENKLFINIPSQAILPIVKLATNFIKLPINEENIEGLINLNFMKTEESLKELGIKIDKINQNQEAKKRTYSPLKIILIGAGKMGTVHLNNLREIPVVNIVGIVDKDKKKAMILKSFGHTLDIYTELDQAIAEKRPDIAIISTPTFTHREILEKCVKEGIHCFVEKPLSTSNKENEEIEKFLRKFPEVKVAVGYYTSYHKHLHHLSELIKNKKVGKIKKVHAHYYLSHIMDNSNKGWEVKKELSGGGVILNAGVHTLNSLCFLFGTKCKVINKNMGKLHSLHVEDFAQAKIMLGGIEVNLDFNWSKKGYFSAQNKIVIETDKGDILLNNVGFMQANKLDKKIIFSDDSSISFNLSPEAGASGYLEEMAQFIDCVVNNKTPLTNIEWAIKVEEIAHTLSK